MAVVIRCMDKPVTCAVCPFSRATSNAETMCEFLWWNAPVEIGLDAPEWCPIEQISAEND